MKTFADFLPHLAATEAEQAEKQADIGRRVRFRRPADEASPEFAAWLRLNGTTARDHEFQIIGVQRIFDGSLAYRVKCLGYDDTMGRAMRFSETEFLSEAEPISAPPTVKRLWWLSFADETGFLGLVLTHGADLVEATQRAWDLEINPGGEVLGFPLLPEQEPGAEYHDKLLDRATAEMLASDPTPQAVH